MEEKNPNINRVELIKKTIDKLGYEYDMLTELTKEMLQKIDIVVDELIEEEKSFYLKLSRVYASINNVSKRTGISNKTFQNNEILKEFLEFRQKDFEKIDQSLQNKKLREENKQLQEMISKMINKDIECEPLRKRNEELEKENSQLRETNNYLINGKIKFDSSKLN